jgi:hypothetical protein
MTRKWIAVLHSLAIACLSTTGCSSSPSNSAPGCSALSACCSKLPASQVPTECDAVASGGTATACATSLSMYQSAGYCVSDGATQDSGALNSLSGSDSEVYGTSFSSVVITLEGSSVAIKYVGTSGSTVLVVDTANIANVAGSSIDLTQLDNEQSRGAIEYLGPFTTDLHIKSGSIVFNQVPTVGSSLSGHFSTTLADPSTHTLNGTFSGTVGAS